MSQYISDTSDNLQKARLLRGQAAQALQKDDAAKAHQLLALVKSLRVPLENIDYLRALTFLKMGSPDAAREAAKEELRYFPHNTAATVLLSELRPSGGTTVEGNEEFQRLCRQVTPYTMVEPLRLHALYTHAVKICRSGPQGNFVECGVAAGGTSGLLSAVLKAYAPSRHLFSCDSFSGMPPATEEDICRDGQNAHETGWGEGTCAAPESSLLSLCKTLGTEDLITPVKGFFEDTLPAWKKRFGPIAFLHMDGDWYSSTKAILENLYDSLAPSAYVQVDDFDYWAGCRKAVIDFFERRDIALDAYAIRGGGIWFRKPSEAQ